MSLVLRRIGFRATLSCSELSLVSVNTPCEPPLIVQVPAEIGGVSAPPWKRMFGLFGRFELPSTIGLKGSKVGLPVPAPKPLRSMIDKPGSLPPRPM